MKKIFLFLLMSLSLLFLLVGCTNEQNKVDDNELDLDDGFFYDKNDIYEDEIYLCAEEDTNKKLKTKNNDDVSETYQEIEGTEVVISEEVKDMLRKKIEMDRFKPRCMTPMINKWRFSFGHRFH